MEFRKASELQTDVSREISRLFADGFYLWLNRFSKDREKLAAAFSDAFSPAYFYVALENGRVVGMAALTDTDKDQPIVVMRLKTLRKHLGFIRGSAAKYFLGKELEQGTYPFVGDADTQSVGYIAVDKDFRGQNIAGRLLRYVIDSSPKKRFVLEVASSNTSALRAYEKFGFKAFTTTVLSEKEQKKMGFERYIYMEYIKQS